MSAVAGLPFRYAHAPGRGLVVAGVLLGLALLGLLVLAHGLQWLEPQVFFQSWLLGCQFWLSLSLGAMPVYMIHQLTGGDWGEPLKPPLQAAMAALPLMALLFIPLAFGVEALFHWAPDSAVHTELIAKKTLYLNEPFQILRLSVYFLIWLGLALALRVWSAPRPGQPWAAWCGPGLALYLLTVTFYAVDWIMALEAHFYSTTFGFLIAASQTAGSLALAVLCIAWLAGPAVTPHRLNDQGNLLLAALLFWIYIVFMQYLIIWSGDLPHEIIWYIHRQEHGWPVVAVGWLLCHFILPFALLLSVALKRHRRALAGIAALVLAGRLLDAYWLVSPSFHPDSAWPRLAELAAVLGVGGLWLAVFVAVLRRYPSVRRAS